MTRLKSIFIISIYYSFSFIYIYFLIFLKIFIFPSYSHFTHNLFILFLINRSAQISWKNKSLVLKITFNPWILLLSIKSRSCLLISFIFFFAFAFFFKKKDNLKRNYLLKLLIHPL